VSVDVSNTGERAGKHVVQLYASRPATAVDRPVRWLVAFAPVEAAAGESVRVALSVPWRAFAHWDDGWTVEPGRFTLHLGTDAGHPTESIEVDIDERGLLS
jgi:beta-glucosidase